MTRIFGYDVFYEVFGNPGHQDFRFLKNNVTRLLISEKNVTRMLISEKKRHQDFHCSGNHTLVTIISRLCPCRCPQCRKQGQVLGPGASAGTVEPGPGAEPGARATVRGRARARPGAQGPPKSREQGQVMLIPSPWGPISGPSHKDQQQYHHGTISRASPSLANQPGSPHKWAGGFSGIITTTIAC